MAQEQPNDINVFQLVPQHEVDKILQDGKTLIDTLLNQPATKMKPIVEAMQLKKKVGKNFTEFLLYIIKLFRNAIENRTITLTSSVRESIKNELDHISLVLLYVRKDFCSNEDEAPPNDPVAIVIQCAVKVTDVIKSLQKKQWLRWFRSAKNISALVPIFERITEVVRGIQCIECRTFSELLGDVAALKASLDDIEKRILVLQGVGLSASILVGIGGIICMIVGGILFVTPAGVPLMAAGAVGIATGGATALCGYIATKRFDHAKVKGDTKGDKFVRNDTTELTQFS